MSNKTIILIWTGMTPPGQYSGPNLDSMKGKGKTSSLLPKIGIFSPALKDRKRKGSQSSDYDYGTTIFLKDPNEVLFTLTKDDNKWVKKPVYFGTRKWGQGTNSPDIIYNRRNFYEAILLNSVHLDNSPTTISQFSLPIRKAVIYNIIDQNEWGNPETTRTLIGPLFKAKPFSNQIFTYWDYMDAWSFTFSHQEKYSWMFYFSTNFEKKTIPTWFTNWWFRFNPPVNFAPAKLTILNYNLTRNSSGEIDFTEHHTPFL